MLYQLMRMTFNQPIYLTAFNYEKSEVEISGVEIQDAMSATLIRQFFSSIVIVATTLLFLYALLFIFFWFLEVRNIITFIPFFRILTLGTVSARELTLGHVVSLTLLMIFVSMFVATGMGHLLIRVIFTKIIGVWF